MKRRTRCRTPRIGLQVVSLLLSSIGLIKVVDRMQIMQAYTPNQLDIYPHQLHIHLNFLVSTIILLCASPRLQLIDNKSSILQ